MELEMKSRKAGDFRTSCTCHRCLEGRQTCGDTIWFVAVPTGTEFDTLVSTSHGITLRSGDVEVAVEFFYGATEAEVSAELVEDGELDVQFINLTPHAIIVISEVANLYPSGQVARVETIPVLIRTVGDIPLFQTRLGDVVDLPDPEAGKAYIVSSLVRAALPDRRDLWSPADLIRDEQGRVVGCRGLTR